LWMNGMESYRKIGGIRLPFPVMAALWHCFLFSGPSWRPCSVGKSQHWKTEVTIRQSPNGWLSIFRWSEGIWNQTYYVQYMDILYIYTCVWAIIGNSVRNPSVFQGTYHDSHCLATVAKLRIIFQLVRGFCVLGRAAPVKRGIFLDPHCHLG
jgi:hypothetical protein